MAMKTEAIPDENVRELETGDYHDGDLDAGVWKEEIPVLVGDAESKPAEKGEKAKK